MGVFLLWTAFAMQAKVGINISNRTHTYIWTFKTRRARSCGAKRQNILNIFHDVPCLGFFLQDIYPWEQKYAHLLIRLYTETANRKYLGRWLQMIPFYSGWSSSFTKFGKLASATSLLCDCIFEKISCLSGWASSIIYFFRLN